MKRHKAAMKGNRVGVGAIVTIKNDFRDISHPFRAVGVVFEAKETGGIQVCTEWGVIVQGKKQKKVYWIPHDRYAVKAARDDACVVSNVLEDIRKQVLTGEFKQIDHAKITLQEAHRRLTNETPKGKRRCKCKEGRYKPNCGCWGKFSCHSGCSCNGNCNNPY